MGKLPDAKLVMHSAQLEIFMFVYLLGIHYKCQEDGKGLNYVHILISTLILLRIISILLVLLYY